MLKDLFTEKDGTSFCPVRAGYVLGFAAIIAFTLTDYKNFMEHAADWIKGMGDYIGLGGAAVAGKNYTEKE